MHVRPHGRSGPQGDARDVLYDGSSPTARVDASEKSRHPARYERLRSLLKKFTISRAIFRTLGSRGFGPTCTNMCPMF